MPLNIIYTSLKLFASHCILFLFTFYTAALVLLVTGCSLCVNNPTRSHMCIYFDSHNLPFNSLSSEEEVAHGMKVWRKALSEVRSAAQLAMCIQQLQKSIAWERSIMKVVRE